MMPQPSAPPGRAQAAFWRMASGHRARRQGAAWHPSTSHGPARPGTP